MPESVPLENPAQLRFYRLGNADAEAVERLLAVLEKAPHAMRTRLHAAELRQERLGKLAGGRQLQAVFLGGVLSRGKSSQNAGSGSSESQSSTTRKPRYCFFQCRSWP